MARRIFVTADGRQFESEAEAVRHGLLLQMAKESMDLRGLLLETLLECPATQRAAESDPSVHDRVSELAGWLVSDPEARTVVGVALRMAGEGVPRPGRHPGKRDAEG